VVSWATGVQNDVEIQMANPIMKGFGSAWLSCAKLVSNRRKNDGNRRILD
jgi:hypothetical protein